MNRYYKPARGKEGMRGIFSYIGELVFNLITIYQSNEEAIVYCDFTNVPGYTSMTERDKNFYNYAFVQDKDDFRVNRDSYTNIEELPGGGYDNYGAGCREKEFREITEKVIQKYLILQPKVSLSIDYYSSSYDFQETISVHRRATDIDKAGGHPYIVPLQRYFDEIDKFPKHNIFLLCDSLAETAIFKEKYGERIISLDTTSSNDITKSYPTLEKPPIDPYNHVVEFIRNVYIASRTKHLIMSSSNVTTFCLMLNKDLPFTHLNAGRVGMAN